MRRLVLSVMAVVLLSSYVRAEEPQCRKVISGNLVLSGGSRDPVAVKEGTFCEYPADVRVSTKLVELDSEVKELKVRLTASEEKLTRANTYATDISKVYEDKIRDKNLEIAYLSGFWNKYGKVILWATIAAGGSAVVTYGVMKLSK